MVAPSSEDLATYATFIRQADTYGRALIGFEAGGKAPSTWGALFAARRRCKLRVLPADQQYRGSPLARLLVLVDRIVTMPLADRCGQGAPILALTDQLRQHFESAGVPAIEPPLRRHRADIDD